MIKEILGALAVVVGFVGFVPYLRDVFLRGTTRPHFFSWFLWGVMEATALIAQVKRGAGAGSWVLGVSAMLVSLVALKALFIGEKNITRLDWAGFAGASIGIVTWWLTKDPTYAVIIIVITDALAFIPTYRKGYDKPFEETLIQYVTSSAKWVLSLLALQTYNLATYLYPASLVVTNGAFSIMIWLRRKRLKTQ